MRYAGIAAIATLAAGLAGCFTADEPLLNEANTIAPYERITFQAEDDNELTTLVREGSAYRAVDEDETLFVRFMQLDPPELYVVEVSGESGPGEVTRLYAMLRVDFANKRAEAFKAVAMDGDTGPGLRACDDDTVCIDDLDAYVALGKAAIDAGDAPQVTYSITVE